MDFMTILSNVINPQCLLLILGGVIMGTIFGCIPGLNSPIAVALVLPFTFTLDIVPSMCLIMGIYMGCASGGLVTAILLKIPGTAAAVATTFDGYPMTQKGKATEALSYGVFASFFGGIFSAIVLLILAPVLARMAIGFGPWEYFGTAILALSIICTLMGNKMNKAFIAVGLGLLLKTVGMSPVDGVAARFTFGSYHLESGFEMVAIIIGLLALPEVISSISTISDVVEPATVEKRRFYIPSWKMIKENLKIMLQGSVIGTAIGILPGMGSGVAGLVSYEQAKRSSKHPEKFGTGIPEGIFSCESANNATTGGALIPMLALGVPGDITTAIIMGAIALQGITAGPLLSLNQPVLFRSIIFIVFVANIFMLLFQSTAIGFMAKIIQVPKYILFAAITVFCVTGTISVNNGMFDVACLFLFLFLGYALDKNEYPISPFVLAVVLGGIIEDNMRRSIGYYGSFTNCLGQVSIGTLFFAIAVIFPVAVIIRRTIKSKKKVSE